MTTIKTYSPIVRGITAAGTGFVGLAAGLALSYSAITFPALARTQGLSKKQKVDFWKAAFDRGIVTVVPVPITGSIAFVSAAICAASYQSGRQVATLSAAAAFSFGHILFTLAFMFPTNKRLEALHKKSALTESEERESSSLIQKWLGFHFVRVSTLLTGFALGLKALAES